MSAPKPNSEAEAGSDRVPQGTISFAGTGTAGTVVTITGANTALEPLVTTTVQANGTWAANSLRELNEHQRRAFTATVTTDGGLTQTTPFTFWTAAS